MNNKLTVELHSNIPICSIAFVKIKLYSYKLNIVSLGVGIWCVYTVQCGLPTFGVGMWTIHCAIEMTKVGLALQPH